MKKAIAILVAVAFLLSIGVPAFADSVTKIGPCCIDSPPEAPHADGNYNYSGPWPPGPDEQSAAKNLPIKVDIVHSLYLNTCEKWNYSSGQQPPATWCDEKQKDQLDLGNVTPLDPLYDKGGTDGFDLCVKSNDEWTKDIAVSNLAGVDGDDAEGHTIPKSQMTVTVQTVFPQIGTPIVISGADTPWVSDPHLAHEEVENILVHFDPVWCNHAGKYTGTITVSATQI